jgi:transcriptional regulator with XRE-family HTH domain
LSLLARFKAARESQGLTLAEVAERMGIDAPALSRLETGKMLNPTLATLYKWAEALGMRLDAHLWSDVSASPSKNGEKQALHAAQALEFLGFLWANCHRVARQVDFELMPCDLQDMHVRNRSADRPFRILSWLARQEYFVAAWSLWEYYSRVFCERLPNKVGRRRRESFVAWIGRSLVANNIPFPRQDWFSGANALRNLIAHYGGRVTEPKARALMESAKTAFPGLESYSDDYVAIENDYASEVQCEVEEFLREMSESHFPA